MTPPCLSLSLSFVFLPCWVRACVERIQQSRGNSVGVVFFEFEARDTDSSSYRTVWRRRRRREEEEDDLHGYIGDR